MTFKKLVKSKIFIILYFFYKDVLINQLQKLIK